MCLSSYSFLIYKGYTILNSIDEIQSKDKNKP